jgi:hypothetical protein
MRRCKVLINKEDKLVFVKKEGVQVVTVKCIALFGKRGRNIGREFFH